MAIEIVVSVVHIFASSTGYFNVISLGQMKRLKNNAIFGSTGHLDNEINLDGSDSVVYLLQKRAR